MRHKVVDGVEVWKQFEDLLIPGLRLSISDRAVYSHLLRHSRLEGKQLLQFFEAWGLMDKTTVSARRKLSAIWF